MNRGIVVAALMMAISLAALDATVVGTAMPTVVGSLGGLSLFSWVFSIYLLTSTVTVPLYGKLADLYGRKPVLLFGCTVFLIGSALCGLAGSMEQLIAFRAVQGFGAGAVLPITLTIIGDMFTIEERARVQGLFSSVWGITSVAGPALGGLITDHLTWRWVFYVNIPLGVASIVLIWLYFREQSRKGESHVLDYWGTVLLSGAIISLLLGLLQGVDAYGWLGAPTLALFGLSALQLVLFIRTEQHASEPILPLSLFSKRIIVVSSLIAFVTGGLMFIVTSYVPLFSQGVLGGSAINAGFVLAPMFLGWPISAVLAGKVILRVGYFPSAFIGGVFLVLGSACLVLLNGSSPETLAMLAALLIGIGMGFSSMAQIISVQNAVEWGQRGVATASVQFFRTIGGSISVAIMGAILNSQMATRLADIEGLPPGTSADTLLNPDERANLAAPLLDAMQQAFAASLHWIYVVSLLTALGAFVVMLFFPRGRAQDLSFENAAAPASEAGVAGGGGAG